MQAPPGSQCAHLHMHPVHCSGLGRQGHFLDPQSDPSAPSWQHCWWGQAFSGGFYAGTTWFTMCPFAYAANPLLVTPLLWIGETRPFLGPPVRPFGPELATLVVLGSSSFCRGFVSSCLGLGLRFPSSSSAWDRISSIRSVSRRVLFRPRNPPR